MDPLYTRIKRLISTSLGIDITIGLLIMAACFIGIYLFHPAQNVPYIVVAVFFLYYFCSSIADWYYDKAVLNGRILRPLQDIGFRIAKVGEQWGLWGSYRGYFFRIHYERSGGYKGASEIYFGLYHSCTDQDTLEAIRSRYGTSMWSAKSFLPHTYEYNVYNHALLRTDRFLYIWSYAGILRRLDQMIAIAEEYHLPPMAEKDVLDMVES